MEGLGAATAPEALALHPPRLGPGGAHTLALLAEHEVLSTTQLRRLTGACERTMQHRITRLALHGLVARIRPPAEQGSSPYLCWLTPLGYAALDMRPPAPFRAPSAARVSAVAVLNEFWSTLATSAAASGIELTCWRRCPDGLPYPGPATGRRLRADAVLDVRVGCSAGSLTARGVVMLDAGAVPASRLDAPVTALHHYVAAGRRHGTSASSEVLLVITRSIYRAERWIAAAGAAAMAAATDQEVFRQRFAVCVATAPSGAPVLDAVWRRADDTHVLRLSDVLRAGAHAEATHA